jgi:hypothetical protein
VASFLAEYSGSVVVVYRQGPAGRAARAAAGALALLVCLGLVVLVPIGIFAAGEDGKLDWNVVLGAAVGAALACGAVVWARHILLDWVKPLVTFEGRVDALEREHLGSDGTGPDPEVYVVRCAEQRWQVPERCWRQLHAEDHVRIRFRAGTRGVVSLEVARRS